MEKKEREVVRRMEKKETEVVRRRIERKEGEDDSEEGGREIVMKWMAPLSPSSPSFSLPLSPSSPSFSLPLSLLPLASSSLPLSEEGERGREKDGEEGERGSEKDGEEGERGSEEED
jgi:hypothetical protein